MFRGRGPEPSIDLPNLGSEEINNTVSNTHHHVHFHRIYRRNVPYTTNLYFHYVLVELVVSIFFIIVWTLTYILTYDTQYIDPINSIKSTYINCQLVFLLIYVSFMGYFWIFSKTKEKAIKHFSILLILSCITILVFIGVKIGFSNTYTEEKFGELYETSEIKGQEINKGLITISEADLKRSYIEDNIKAYSIFEVKTTVITLLHIFALFINMLMIIKVIKSQEVIDRLEQDDAILYDENENIKI